MRSALRATSPSADIRQRRVEVRRRDCELGTSESEHHPERPGIHCMLPTRISTARCSHSTP